MKTSNFLKVKRLDKDYFNTLLTGGDPVKEVLQWLDKMAFQLWDSIEAKGRFCRGL